MAGGTVSNVIAMIVGVGVAILVLIFVGSLGGQSYQMQESNIEAIANNNITGESETMLNDTTMVLNHRFIQEGTLWFYNGSGVAGYRWSEGNVSMDYDAGTFTQITGGSIHNNTPITVTYMWGAVDVRNSIKDSVVSSFSSLDMIGNYLPIIVLAVVIALVLSLVLGFTMLAKPGQGGAL